MSKVVLIQPPDPPRKQVLRDHMGNFGILRGTVSIIRDDVLPPIDLAYSASLLEKNNHEVKIIDAPTLRLNVDKAINQIPEDVDLVVVNTAGVSIKKDIEFASKIKNSIDTLIAVSGPFVTLRPDIALRNKEIDVVVRGEKEQTILELTEKISNFEKTDGIAFRKNNEIVLTKDRSFIQNLDELPFPAYHLLPMDKYSYHLLERKPFTTFLSSRGCPFMCIYCPYPLNHGNVWRGRSPENVLSEIKFLVDTYGVKSILFRDQVFSFDTQRTEKICGGIIDEGLDVDWICETRIDRLSKDLMKKMKEAGCVRLHLGIESGDPEILKKIGKVGLNIDMIKKRFREAKEIGLDTSTFFMIGLPGETKKSISRTFKLAKELNSNSTWFTAVAPYPGTKLYELAEKKDWILTKNWEKYSGREVVMRTDDLSEDDIKEALKNAKELFSGNFLRIAFSKKGISTALSEPGKTFGYALNRMRRKLNVFKS